MAVFALILLACAWFAGSFRAQADLYPFLEKALPEADHFTSISGGNYAVAAARALLAHSSLGAEEIVRTALEIAAEIDIHTNTNIVVETLKCES